MKILGVAWISTMQGMIGIILTETEFDDERAYILPCSGEHEISDIKYIVSFGSYFPVHIARQLISETGRIFNDLYI